nr:uncharacterized protein LOC127339982 [Lolium perenne]
MPDDWNYGLASRDRDHPPEQNKLRNKISDKYLNNCTVIFVERELFNQVKDEDVINLFQKGACKVILSTLDPPYRIPPERFSPPPPNVREDWSLLDCRHGRLLFDDWKRRQVVVWDPITDDYRVVVEPPQFLQSGFAVIYSGAVLCAAGELGHVHGDCHSSPFQVVLLATLRNAQVFTVATVYSSKTGMWSDLLSTPFSSFGIYRNNPPGILVGNTIHWMLIGGTSGIQFDLDSQRLTVIESPPGFHDSLQIIHSEDGGVAFATLSGPWNTPCFQIWEREVNSYGVTRWELRKTVELQKILGLRFKIDTELSSIVGYAEDINAIFFVGALICLYGSD